MKFLQKMIGRMFLKNARLVLNEMAYEKALAELINNHRVELGELVEKHTKELSTKLNGELHKE